VRDRRPRVLHVGKFYPPYMGGMETHLQTLCNLLRDTVELRVVVANLGREHIRDVVDGVTVDRVGTLFNVSSAPINPAMASEIRRSDADIVHLHHPNPAAMLAYLASGHRGQLVVTYHSDVVRQRVLGKAFEPFLERVLARSSAIIATSPNYLATSPVLARHEGRCHVIPLGIDVQPFAAPNLNAVRDIRERYGARIILGVGRLIYYKGFEVLVDAMAEVVGHLLIIGEGPLRSQLERRAADLGVADRVTFLGNIPDMVPFYYAAAVFALPSIARSEAFGLVQLEAMASGTPVINTRLDSGVPFVSLHGMTGLTVTPGHVGELAAALQCLLDNPELRREFGEAGKRRVAVEFSAEVMVERTLALYENVLGSRLPHLSAMGVTR
jgi:glycosyltransferase involved in cell wall biosynthesis